MKKIEYDNRVLLFYFKACRLFDQEKNTETVEAHFKQFNTEGLNIADIVQKAQIRDQQPFEWNGKRFYSDAGLIYRTFVADGFIRTKTKSRISAYNINDKRLFSLAGLRQYYGKDLVFLPGYDCIPIADFILNEREADQNPLYEIRYDPALIAGKNGCIYNTYTDFTVDGVDTQVDISPIYYHIKEIICNGDETVYKYLLDWIAHLFQRPEEKPMTAIGMRSIQGTGKTLLVDGLLGKILGENYYTSSSPADLQGRFNTAIANKLLLSFNEGSFADAKVMGMIKSLITDKTMRTERKFWDAEIVDTYCRLIFVTNSEQIVQISGDDRRFFILEVSSSRKGDKKYFDTLVRCIDEGRGQFLYEMLNRDISGFKSTEYPRTAALADQKKLSLDSVGNFFLSYFEQDLKEPPHFDSIDGGQVIVKATLYEHYKLFCIEKNARPCFAENVFAQKVLTLFGDSIESYRSLRYSSRRPSFRFNVDMRLVFEKNTGIRIEETNIHNFSNGLYQPNNNGGSVLMPA